MAAMAVSTSRLASGESSQSLLRTKLYIPPARRNRVVRPRLTQILNETYTHKLTLISAPAGFGKTTAISEWIPQSEHCVAWLSLDAGDNDQRRFGSHVIAALQTLGTSVGALTASLFESLPPVAFQAVITSLVNEIDAFPQTFALVLDDYHVIETPAIHDSLAFLLEHLPPRMHLIISTRADPPIPLGRLRARGELTEIRAADLRFTPEEATAFLNQVMGLNLAPDAIATLETRTEGWIAGLQLAALSMQAHEAPDRAHFIAAFSGSHQYVLDYLAEEVLNRQPERVRSFLLQTSILDRLCGPLCDAVIGVDAVSRVDGQAMLPSLEQRNLFVVPLDDERRWYRYHHLFTDVLNQRLEQSLPDRLPELHRRAAGWYEQNGFVAEAIHHALAAGDQGRAVELIEQHGCLLLIRGEVTTLLRWIEAVEPHVQPRPWICIFKAWAFALTGDLDRVEGLLQRAEELMPPLGPAPEVRTMRGVIAAARAHRANLRGEARLAADFARQALDDLPDSDLVTRSLRTVATSLLGDASAMTGDLEVARQAYLESARIGQAAGDVHLTIVVNSNLANILTEQGQLRQAAGILSETLAMANRPDGQKSVIAGRACVELSQIDYEWNRLEDARVHVEQGLALCRQWGNMDLQAVCHAQLARLEHVAGHPERALAAKQAAAQLANDYDLAPRYATWVKSTLARLSMAQGELAPACQFVQERGIAAGDEIPYLREPEYFVLLRVLLAQGDCDAALALSQRLLEGAEATNRTGRAIEALILQALAWQAKQEPDQALAALGRAVALAQPEGFVRVFLDEGEPAAKLLYRARAQRIGGSYLSALLSALGETTGAREAPDQGLVEPLSQRELEVLQLIATGHTNQQIASQLVISVPTVKRHLSNLYGKLGVSSRTQAIALGRELKLFE